MRLLCLSNGHGEDRIAGTILAALQQMEAAAILRALPLVGTGQTYRQLGIPLVGPARNLPSGGFLQTGLAEDMRAGLWGRLLVGLFLLIGGVGVAQAQPNPFLASVRQQLREAGRAAEREGYRLSHDPFTGKLRPRDAEFITITLRAGVNYIIVAVCDQDCRDMDLRLFDENRNFIDEDMRPDAIPVVSVTPRRTATFRIQAIMSHCAAPECLYGVGAFAR